MNWLKRKLITIAISLSNVEKNAFSQKTETLDSNIGSHSEKDTGTLLHALKNNIMNQEVKNLRWRMYKIIMAADGFTTEITGRDKDGMPITKTTKKDKTKGLSKVKVDIIDSYPVEMVVDTTEITAGGNDAMDNEFIHVFDTPKKYTDKDGDEIASHGEIKSLEYNATNKGKSPLIIGRLFIPKFNIEDYTKKLVVRTINDTEKLIEFYVSMYPNEENKNSKQFINDIKKAIESPLATTFLELKEVGFVTYKTLGVDDFLSYHYTINSLDKIIEFNGHYVVKYLATVSINGENITEQYREEELDNRYENKEKRK